MKIDQFTQKSMAALETAQRLAQEYGNPEVDVLHLNKALLSDNEGLIPKVLNYMGVDPRDVENAVDREINRLSRQTGADPRMSSAMNGVLTDALKEAKRLGDSYVSVEHLYLAMIKGDGVNN